MEQMVFNLPCGLHEPNLAPNLMIILQDNHPHLISRQRAQMRLGARRAFYKCSAVQPFHLVGSQMSFEICMNNRQIEFGGYRKNGV